MAGQSKEHDGPSSLSSLLSSLFPLLCLCLSSSPLLCSLFSLLVCLSSSLFSVPSCLLPLLSSSLPERIWAKMPKSVLAAGALNCHLFFLLSSLVFLSSSLFSVPSCLFLFLSGCSPERIWAKMPKSVQAAGAVNCRLFFLLSSLVCLSSPLSSLLCSLLPFPSHDSP